MELTISQIGSASPHWVARYVPAAGATVRNSGPNIPEAADNVAPAPTAKLADLETEYDQFGRFGVSSGQGVSGPYDYRHAINATKHFRSGQATVGDLVQEYARSLAASTAGDESEAGVRRFIPAYMTEYQAYQLQDFQYRWAIEVERRVLMRMEDAERAGPAVAEVSAAERSGPGERR